MDPASAAAPSEVTIRVVGEVICRDTHLKGYNTFVRPPPLSPASAAFGGGGPSEDREQTIVASACGVVETVDRVVSVRGACPRYAAEVGDVVVARIVDVLSNKWLCDVRSPQLAHLLLASVTEPGGMLRRRGREDELTMRSIFSEGDLVVAEVQRVSPDGAVSLHSRSASKYGRVTSQGTLVPVSTALVRRVRKHYHVFSFGVSAVFGVNGNVWVYRTTQQSLVDIGAVVSESAGGVDLSKGASGAGMDPVFEDDGEGSGDEAKAVGGRLCKGVITDNAEALHAVARARNALVALAAAGHSVEPATLRAVWLATHQRKVPPAEMLRPEWASIITDAAASVRDQAATAARKRRRE